MKGLCRDKTFMNVVDGLDGFRVEGSRCRQKPDSYLHILLHTALTGAK